MDKPFSFTIDRESVLTLLAGHLLYNDADAVIRELVQNSIDAVRYRAHLEAHRQHNSNAQVGQVHVRWDPCQRVLTVSDNGVGMTRSVIESNLLAVGSSFYQSDSVKRRFPDFFPISRFGIGILSLFMVADSVEITTASTDEDSAWHLELRSALGRYLIRVLDKEMLADPIFGDGHGTRVKVHVRSSAAMSNVLNAVKKWALFPGCRVLVSIGDNRPLRAGFRDPRHALKSALEDAEFCSQFARPHAKHKVRQLARGSTQVAFIVEWSESLRAWRTAQFRDRLDRAAVTHYQGLAVHGIRVLGGTPALDGNPFPAVANTTGPAVVNTTVQRTDLEESESRDTLYQVLCDVYCGHVSREIRRSNDARGCQIGASTSCAWQLLQPLLGEEDRPPPRPPWQGCRSRRSVTPIGDLGLRRSIRTGGRERVATHGDPKGAGRVRRPVDGRQPVLPRRRSDATQRSAICSHAHAPGESGHAGH